MVEVTHSDALGKIELIEKFFKHKDLVRVTGQAHYPNIKERVIALDCVQGKDGDLRISIHLKSKRLDGLFRLSEDVFDGWDCFYSLNIPNDDDVKEIERISTGIESLFARMHDFLGPGESFWFVAKDVDHFYRFQCH